MTGGAPSPEAPALVVAPEPCDWLGPVLEDLEAVGPVEVFAPWVLPRVLSRVGRSVGFVRRRDGRELPGARGYGWFNAAELVMRGLGRGRTAATLGNRVRMRALADRVAAWHIARGPTPRMVIAPSLAARYSFSQAHRMGSACVLVEDMPDLDDLVDGLDGLARSLPQATFLRNHRPSHRAHARQRAERWQADVIGVRGRAAWHRIGSSKARVLLPRVPFGPAGNPGRDVLFAGPPLARCGSDRIPELLASLPELTLRVLPGPCSEPSSLSAHPQIRVHQAYGLEGIAAVVSLSPLESHPTPVARALDAGIPVVGTLASTGVVDPTSVLQIESASPRLLAEAVTRALTSDAPRPRAWRAPRTLAQYVAGSSRTLEVNSALAPSVRSSVPTT